MGVIAFEPATPGEEHRRHNGLGMAGTVVAGCWVGTVVVEYWRGLWINSMLNSNSTLMDTHALGSPIHTYANLLLDDLHSGMQCRLLLRGCERELCMFECWATVGWMDD